MSSNLRASCVLLALGVGACASTPTSSTRAPVADGSRARLAILESTDLHSNILGYDYYRVADDPSLGFERMATLVRSARKEFTNTLLFDAGDTIQGTGLADYQALIKPVGCGEELSIYRVMDELGYDGGTVGNHEFNYGLGFLSQVTGQPMGIAGADRKCAGPHYPLVLANVKRLSDGHPIYPPYAVLDRTLTFRDAGGQEKKAPIRIGIIGFTPPTIVDWDRRNLEGKVTTKGLVEAAREYLPTLRAENVDLVIAISHGGLDVAPYGSAMENANWYLSQEPGIDALLLGHSHAAFPDPSNAKSRYASMPEVDNQRGFVHGKPAVMGNFWGKSLGLIDMVLVYGDGRWQIDTAATHSEVRNIRNADGSFVAPDPVVASMVQQVHKDTIAYVSQPIGGSDFALTSYFAEVGSVTALQPVNDAQREYAQQFIAKNLPQYAGIPVLSAAAPFKTGFSSANDYTDIPAGPLAIHDAADLYLYPNTLTAVKIDGAAVKAWLEHAAGLFNRIDPAKTEPQELINHKFSGYNFDVIQGGLTYTIDVTREQRQRIGNLEWNGKPVDPGQAFIVVTNNYRASGGGRFPGLDGSSIVVSAPDANRDVLIGWVRQRQHLTRAANGSDRNWHFAPVITAGPIVFTSAADKVDVATREGLRGVTLLENNADGSASYAIDLSATR